jgi:AcrR family transcriptional regulator
MFNDKGWAATSMRELAAEAGVSVETVYSTFGSKADLLMAALDVAVVGDTEPVPLDQRTAFSALGVGTRMERIRAAAMLITGIHRRTAGVILALREAAASDADLDREMRNREQGRRSNVAAGMSMISGAPVTEHQADAMWAVVDIGLYRMLTDLRGWTDEQYETWLADAIDRLLDTKTPDRDT